MEQLKDFAATQTVENPTQEEIFSLLVNINDVILTPKDINDKYCLYLNLQGNIQTAYAHPEFFVKEIHKPMPKNFHTELQIEERVKLWMEYHLEPLEDMWNSIPCLSILNKLSPAEIKNMNLHLNAQKVLIDDIIKDDLSNSKTFLEMDIVSKKDVTYFLEKITEDYNYDEKRLDELDPYSDSDSD